MGANAMEAAIRAKRVTIWKVFMVVDCLSSIAVGSSKVRLMSSKASIVPIP